MVSPCSQLSWSGISPAADPEGKVFPLVLVKDRAEQSSAGHPQLLLWLWSLRNVPARAGPAPSGHVSMGCHWSCSCWGCWVRDSRLGPGSAATSLLGPSHCTVQAENDSLALPWPSLGVPWKTGQAWPEPREPGDKLGRWRNSKQNTAKQSSISQLQIVRKVHGGFCLAGSDGEAFPLQLQAMARCPLLGPAVPTGAGELQLVGVPRNVGFLTQRVHFWPSDAPKLPMGVPPSPDCFCARQGLHH